MKLTEEQQDFVDDFKAMASDTIRLGNLFCDARDKMNDVATTDGIANLPDDAFDERADWRILEGEAAKLKRRLGGLV